MVRRLLLSCLAIVRALTRGLFSTCLNTSSSNLAVLAAHPRLAFGRVTSKLPLYLKRRVVWMLSVRKSIPVHSSRFSSISLCRAECDLKAGGTLCRSADRECDLPEFCTGETEYCPDDLFRDNGEACRGGEVVIVIDLPLTCKVAQARMYLARSVEGTFTCASIVTQPVLIDRTARSGEGIVHGRFWKIAFCYQGMCRTHDTQCQLLWGPSGRNGHDKCYELKSQCDQAGSVHKKCRKRYVRSFVIRNLQGRQGESHYDPSDYVTRRSSSHAITTHSLVPSDATVKFLLQAYLTTLPKQLSLSHNDQFDDVESDISECEDSQEDSEHDACSEQSEDEEGNGGLNSANNVRFFYGKGSQPFKWSANPPQRPSVRTPVHNLVRKLPGTIGEAKKLDKNSNEKSVWLCVFNQNMLDKILQRTNEEIQSVQSLW
ncbi:hypothetical protein PR048_009612 [Dryococelus australis]|uniref:Disintegrin domain-containing protein n=1 Tax=Dryococelus australis TaxID=614101 RepID=A0ABQ9I0C8_9NEOP|nr:hypothetical protein PR048_009612 [Dryococelus australis]